MPRSDLRDGSAPQWQGSDSPAVLSCATSGGPTPGRARSSPCGTSACDIDDGEFVAIVGPSGSGKSTLLQIIGLLDRPTSGETLLDGRPWTALGDAARTRLRLSALGFVFQRFHLLPGLSAVENVVLPMEAAGRAARGALRPGGRLWRSSAWGTVWTSPRPSLSGGQRQRVAIARALGNNPRLILADEPTGELHSDDTAVVIELFRRFTSARGTRWSW